MSRAYDLIIVGAGIVGAACAAECAQAGLHVLVVDHGPIGGGTTGAGMGHLVVMDDSEAQFALTAYSVALWKQHQLPAQLEYDPCGTLWLAADEQELAEVHRKQKYYSDRGVKTEVLDERSVHQAEPNLRPGMAGGLVGAEDSVLYPPAAARYLMDRASAAGAEFRQGVAVTQLKPEGGVVLADGTQIPAQRVVNAIGPWSPALCPGLPVRKRKGHLLITDRYPGFVNHQIIELGYLKSAHSAGKDSVAFNIQPRKNGQMLIGSSRQFEAEDTHVEQNILDRMLKRALEYLPALGQLSSIRAWTGHRAATPDKLPIIGPSIDNNHIWLATGHEGLGITTSLGTARILTDLLLGRPTQIPSAPYAPSRFANS